jgi:hypothetical protein
MHPAESSPPTVSQVKKNLCMPGLELAGRAVNASRFFNFLTRFFFGKKELPNKKKVTYLTHVAN